MGQSNHTRLLVGGVIVAGIAIFGLATFLRKLDQPRATAKIETATSADRPETTRMTPVTAEDDAGSRMETIPDPALTVTPVNEEGLPLHLARIVVQGPGGTLEASGMGAWEEMEPGEWTVDVACEGYLDAHQKVTIIDGGQPDLIVTLFRSVEVNGRVIDSVGSPVALTAVRFLQKDARPRMPRATRGEPQALTQPDGTFSIQLKEAREYRVSVGAGTEPLLSMDTAIQLGPGAHHLDIVVPGRGSVELMLTDLPNAATAKEGSLHARIYTRRLARSNGAGAGPGLGDPSQQGTRPILSRSRDRDLDEDPRRGGKRRMIGSPKSNEGDGSSDPKPTVTPTTPVDPFDMEPLGPEWIHKVSSVVGTDGSASFDRLLPDREYRLVLEIRRVRFQSVETFQVDPERTVTLRAAVPPLPTNAEGKTQKGSIRPLNLFVNYRSAGADVPPVGFHWKRQEQ